MPINKNNCPKSEYKDNRHRWKQKWIVSGVGYGNFLWLYYCPNCGLFEISNIFKSKTFTLKDFK